MLTLQEKWARWMEGDVSHITQEYLSALYPIHISDDNWVIAGNLLPNPRLVKVIKELSINEALIYEGDLIAARLSSKQFDQLINQEQIDELEGYVINDTPVRRLMCLADLVSYHAEEMILDFSLLTKVGESHPLEASCSLIGDEDQLFIEPDVEAKHAILDTRSGPIYIAAGTTIAPGALIRGPFSAGEHSTVNMGAKIQGAVALGQYCKVGGELKNVSFLGYSNKGHEGFIGDSAIGAWCNIGADSNSSNLKNDYAEVRLYDHVSQQLEPTGRQFLGLIMGDHSKCGINTMFNTGTVIGVSCNIFGGGFTSKFVPSFSWGGGDQYSEYRLDKAIEVAGRVVARRNKRLSEQSIAIFQHLFDSTAYQRRGAQT